MKYTNYFKVLGALLGVILSVVYIAFSYKQTSQDLLHQNETLLFKTKKEMTEALEQFYGYVDLIGSRLLYSFHDKSSIPQILSLKAEHLVKGNVFPEITSLSFTPAADPTLSYSKYGETTLTVKIQQENALTYLGKGAFKMHKILYGKDQKPFGQLHVIFSLEHLLYKHFLTSKISLLPENPENQVNITTHPFTFKLFSLPYAFVLNYRPLSFQDFLSDFKGQLLAALAFAVSFLLIGTFLGTYLRRAIIMRYRNNSQKLRETAQALKKQDTQLALAQNLIELKEKARKGIVLLLNILHSRYRQMATEAQSINVLTSRLIAEETDNDDLLKSIRKVSKEGITVLDRLAKGYPLKETEEELDVLQSIENVRLIFLSSMIERNVTFEVKGRIRPLPFIDQLAFEIVLHNIFHMIMGRLIGNNVFRVTLKKGKIIEITFQDDGYPIEEKLHLYKAKHNSDLENILCLGRHKLKEFTNYLGWTLAFHKEKGGLNFIKLSIPHAFQENSLPSNVINFFDFQSART